MAVFKPHYRHSRSPSTRAPSCLGPETAHMQRPSNPPCLPLSAVDMCLLAASTFHAGRFMTPSLYSITCCLCLTKKVSHNCFCQCPRPDSAMPTGVLWKDYYNQRLKSETTGTSTSTRVSPSSNRKRVHVSGWFCKTVTCLMCDLNLILRCSVKPYS